MFYGIVHFVVPVGLGWKCRNINSNFPHDDLLTTELYRQLVISGDYVQELVAFVLTSGRRSVAGKIDGRTIL